jgi:hypothetical protein
MHFGTAPFDLAPVSFRYTVLTEFTSASVFRRAFFRAQLRGNSWARQFHLFCFYGFSGKNLERDI